MNSKRMQMPVENQPLKRCRIGLFGHYGQNNLGDEAVILSAIQNLRERLPDVELIGLSLNPDNTYRRYGIESYPIRYRHPDYSGSASLNGENSVDEADESTSLNIVRRIKDLIPIRTRLAFSGFFNLFAHFGAEIQFLRQVKTRLKDIDILMICGSGQLEDFGGPWGYPYTILKWVLLAQATETRVFIVSIGAGPPSHRLSYWMYRKVLARADYISYRNAWSREKMEEKIPGVNGMVYPDLAHSLKFNVNVNETAKVQKSVAINPMPAFDKILMKGAKHEKFEIYLDNLVQLASHILSRGYTVKLFNSDGRDRIVIDEVLARVKRKESGAVEPDTIRVIHNSSVEELMNTFTDVDLVVATRFHSTVLPLKLGKPVIGLCYHVKAKDVLETVGLGSYYVDIYDFTAEELCAKFDRLSANLEEVSKTVALNYRHISELMNEQWDRLEELIRQEEQKEIHHHKMKIQM